MKINRAAMAAMLVAGAGLSGCGTLSRALGGGKATPDEFRVVTQAPLVVPPEYALRPPAPGEPRPQELAPESAARNAVLGARANIGRSPGEQALLGRVGADQADPLIRYVVDDEFGDLAHKERSWAERVMFWRRPASPTASAAPTAAQTGAAEVAPVDAAAEQARLQELTGGRPIVIQRERRRTVKLPGL